jgi:hypothetical protein
MNTTIKIALAAFALSLLAGCGGGDTYVRVQGTTTISKGQELTDLQRALKEGAVTKQEYDRLYSKILARPN